MGENTIISFIYNVTFNSNKNGFINFDIDDTNIEIDKVLLELDNISLKEIDSPIYVYLSSIFFSKLKDVESISFESKSMKSIINRNEL